MKELSKLELRLNRLAARLTTLEREALTRGGNKSLFSALDVQLLDNGIFVGMTALSTEPPDPVHGLTYLDDGTNTISGQKGYRRYDDGAASYEDLGAYMRVDGEIDHDALLNFVADEHVAHTSVVLTAGEGLQGGGNISASRTLAMAINSLTADGSPAMAADYLATWDASATAHKKVLLQALGFLLLTGGTMTGSIAMGAGLTVDGVDVGQNIALYIQGVLKQNGHLEGGLITLSSETSKAITLSPGFTGANTYVGNAQRNASSGASVVGLTHDSGSQMTVYMSAAFTGQVRWLAFGN